jgi:hypothetical protein
VRLEQGSLASATPSTGAANGPSREAWGQEVFLTKWFVVRLKFPAGQNRALGTVGRIRNRDLSYLAGPLFLLKMFPHTVSCPGPGLVNGFGKLISTFNVILLFKT